MSLRRRMLPAVFAVLLALPLAACATGATPSPTKTSVATATPLFSSDDEALKAATKAYAAYLKMSDSISHDGGAHPERIKPLVTNQQYARELKGFKAIRARSVHTTGSTGFDSMRITNMTGTEVNSFVCVVGEDVRVLNESEQDITPDSKPSRMAFEVAFEPKTAGDLLVSRSDVWSGENFC